MPSLGYSGPLLVDRSMLSSMRLWHGLTQQELADRIGVSRRTVSSLERGRSIPSVAVAQALAAALDVSVEELFGCAELR